MLWTILINIMVKILVAVIEKWWAKNHPTVSPALRSAFEAAVESRPLLKLVPRHVRAMAADRVYGQFQQAYLANPPVMQMSDAPLGDDQAATLAARYTAGIKA